MKKLKKSSLTFSLSLSFKNETIIEQKIYNSNCSNANANNKANFKYCNPYALPESKTKQPMNRFNNNSDCFINSRNNNKNEQTLKSLNALNKVSTETAPNGR